MAKAIQNGQLFRFPDDEQVYVFWSLTYEDDQPVIEYFEQNSALPKFKGGYHLSDLITRL